MNKLKIRMKDFSMEAVGTDEFIQREREAFMEYVGKDKKVR